MTYQEKLQQFAALVEVHQYSRPGAQREVKKQITALKNAISCCLDKSEGRSNLAIAKLAAFAVLVNSQQKQRHEQLYSYPFNNPVSVKPGSKYDKVDVGSSGRFMVEVRTGNIFGIKGYGQVHKGYFYGTLDTVSEYHWGNYYPEKLDGSVGTQKGRGSIPAIIHAP